MSGYESEGPGIEPKRAQYFGAKKKFDFFHIFFPGCFQMVLSSQKTFFDYIRTQWNAQWGHTWPQPGPRGPAKLPFWPILANLEGFGAKIHF